MYRFQGCGSWQAKTDSVQYFLSPFSPSLRLDEVVLASLIGQCTSQHWVELKISPSLPAVLLPTLPLYPNQRTA